MFQMALYFKEKELKKRNSRKTNPAERGGAGKWAGPRALSVIRVGGAKGPLGVDSTNRGGRGLGGGRGLEALCVDAVGVATLKGGRDQPPLWAWPRSVWAWSSVTGRGGGRSQSPDWRAVGGA